MTPSLLTTDSWQVSVDDAVVDLSAAPDGRVAVAGAEGSVTILSADGVVESRQVVAIGALAVAWSPAGNRIAVGSMDGVHILDAAGNEVAARSGGWCASVAWSFDGARLAAGVGRTAVVLQSDGRELFSAQRDSTVTGVAWINRRVAVAAYGGVHVHHVSRGAAPDVMAFTGSLLALEISPDRRWAASGNQDATLHIWRVGRDGAELGMSGYPRKVDTLAFSPDSALLASGGGQDVTVWDFTGTGPRGTTPRVLEAHDDAVTSVAWSCDGGLLAGAGADGRVALWRARVAVPGRPLQAADTLTRESPATVVQWDQSGRLLAGWADSTVVAHVVERG